MTCTTLILCDGTVSAPSLSFTGQTNLGMYYIGTNQMGFSVGSNGLGMEVGDFSVTNIIPSPFGSNTVRYTSSIFTQPLGGDVESTGLYFKMNHATSQMVYCLYGEIDANQSGDGGSFTKVNHLGAGDAHYVAQFGVGSVGYESASYANNTTGFLADVQIAGLPNAIMFNALWDQGTIPNYGIFVATAVPANALTISKFSDGYEGNVQIRITEPNYGYDRFEVFNNGQVNQIALNSTSSNILTNAPEQRQVATYWNGTASVQQHGVMGHAMTGTGPTSSMYFKAGPYGSEQLMCYLSPVSGGGGELDLQGGFVVNCNSIQSTAATTVAANGTVVAQFSYDSVDATGALALNVVSKPTATAGTATLPANPLGFMIIELNGTNVKVPYYAV